MRALAQVAERAVLVEGHLRHRLARLPGFAGEVVEDLDLERLAVTILDRPALVKAHLATHEGMVGGHGGSHPALDGLEVRRREGPRQVEVVVEAVLDGRPDAEASAREQVHDGLCHHVRRAVTHRIDGGVSPRVQQLFRRASLGGLERDVVLVVYGYRGLVFSHHQRLPSNRRPLVRLDERFGLPRGPEVVGDTGLEPVTSCMSSMRANQLRQSPFGRGG